MKESGYQWNPSNWNECPPLFERRKVQERTEWGWSVDRISQDMAIPVEKVEQYLEEARPRTYPLARDIGSGIGTVFMAVFWTAVLAVVIGAVLIALAMIW